MTAARSVRVRHVGAAFTARQAKLYDAAYLLLVRTGSCIVSYVAKDSMGQCVAVRSGHLAIACFHIDTFEKRREVNITVKDGDRLVFDAGFVVTFKKTAADQEDFVRADVPGSWEGWLLSRRPRERKPARK